ncbi:MAG: tRNA pseudouridine(13) synthase TruD [Candidatus Uhrbacteria bacterium]|nr:tRNA pseudouridine(13) synthase TruD [Candidatus Uhrbacteria bacterium]
MSDILTTSHLREAEHALIEAIRAQTPERVARPASPDPDEILHRIGITYLPSTRPNGFIKLYPHDFLVEELSADGSTVSLSHPSLFQSAEDQRTLWADLIKANISGPHAMSDLQQLLGVEAGKIGYAGIKDSMAVTSQRLSLRGVTKEAAEQLTHDRMMLRPIRYGSGAIQPGELKGNRFTIAVRTALDEDINHLLQKLNSDGFLNFFGAQRFGPRLVAQRMGQKLLQDDAEGALRFFFGEPGPFDIPLYREVRETLKDAFGNWDYMIELASCFPFTFQNELKVLHALQKEPSKTRQALGQIQEQVKMWVYAYGSWLVNRHLSHLVESGQTIAQELPLALSEQGPPAEYRDFMEQDGTMQYLEMLHKYPYVQAARRNIPARIIPEGLVWKKIKQGWVIRFSLPKGAYATTCLSHLFRLYENLPVPEWVKGDEIEVLQAIDDGTISSLRERFASVLVRRDLKAEEKEEDL